MQQLFEWYIVNGAGGKLCVVPKDLVKDRQVIKKIKCSGLLDAVRQLHNFEPREE